MLETAHTCNFLLDMDAQGSSPPSFTELNDLSCEDIGGRVIFATDDWFAGKMNINKEVTPKPRTALLVCLKKYSAIGNNAIGNYVVLWSKLILKSVLLEASYEKMIKNIAMGGLLNPNKIIAIWKSVLREAVLHEV